MIVSVEDMNAKLFCSFDIDVIIADGSGGKIEDAVFLHLLQNRFIYFTVAENGNPVTAFRSFKRFFRQAVL